MSQCRLNKECPLTVTINLYTVVFVVNQTTRHWIEQDKHLTDQSFLHNLGVEEIGSGVGFIEVNAARVNTCTFKSRLEFHTLRRATS